MEDLPNEMIVYIIKYLDIPAALNMSRVNKFYRDLVRRVLLITVYELFPITKNTRYYLNCRKYEIREDIYLDPKPNTMCNLANWKEVFANKMVCCSNGVTNMAPFELCLAINMSGCKDVKPLNVFKRAKIVNITNTDITNFEAGPVLNLFRADNNEARINFKGFPKRMNVISAVNNAIEEITDIEAVKTLVLDSNLITNLGSIKKVEYLSVTCTYITAISGLPNLQVLRANYTDLVTLNLETPKTLKSLEISGTNLPNLNMLVDMSNLECLAVDKFIRSIKVVEHLTNLKYLSIMDSGLVEEEVDVSNLKNLLSLGFSRNVVGFEKLTQLAALKIDGRLLYFQDILDKLKLLTNLKNVAFMGVDRPEMFTETIDIWSYLPKGCNAVYNV